MAYNGGHNNNDGWGSNQRNTPFNNNGPNDRYINNQHHGRYAHNFQPAMSQNHEAAWRQRQQGNDHSMNYIQNVPQQHAPFHQNHLSSHGYNSKPKQPQKRAAKRRYRHDLPGPAGAWFQQHKQKNKRKYNTDKIKEVDAEAKSAENDTPSKDAKKTDKVSAQHNVQLYKDYSSQLHDCNAWNLMCLTHERIVPKFSSFSNMIDEDKDSAASLYKNLLRNVVPRNHSLIHEIHSGQYDVHHLSPSIHTNDLSIPLLFGYVASISCHTHSDWTAVLVDESFSCGGGRGVTCWLEEKLVKRHPGWIRPGVVWMLDRAKLALFASQEESDDDSNDINDGKTNDTSPSTEAARGGKAIDRMICVGEASLVYAWTPEEASQFFTDDQFTTLLERRCNIDLETGAEITKGQGHANDHDLIERVPITERLDFNRDEHVRTIGDSKKKTGPVISCTDGVSPAATKLPQVECENLDENAESRCVDEAIKQTSLLHQQRKNCSGVDRTVAQQSSAAAVSSGQSMTNQLTHANEHVNHTESISKHPFSDDIQADITARNVSKQNSAVAIVTTSPQESTRSSERTTDQTTLPNQSAENEPDAPTHAPCFSKVPAQKNPYLKQSSAKTTSLSRSMAAETTSTSNSYQKYNKYSTSNMSSSKSVKSNQMNVFSTSANSFDNSLGIDDDDLFKPIDTKKTATNDICTLPLEVAEQEPMIVNVASAPVLPPVQSSVSENNETRDRISKQNQAAAPTTTQITTANSSNSPLPMNGPPTGASFDDSLDIDDDELFGAKQKKSTIIDQPPTALNIMPAHNCDISPLRTSTFENQKLNQPQINRTALAADDHGDKETPILPPGSYAFDNIDDDDLDSLGEEDDI